jgi:WD40 repeat protein
MRWHVVLIPGHQGKVSGLAELPDHLLLSCSDDRTLRVWDLGTMKQVHVSPGIWSTDDWQ